MARRGCLASHGGRFRPKTRGAQRALARAEAGVAADAWTLLFVGSGFERKGLDTVIDALAISADRSSRLIVIGRGATRPFRERAARLAVDTRIAWLGPRPHGGPRDAAPG